MLKFSIYDQLSRRILVLDGGLGTMIQGYGLGEEDYRGERFAGSDSCFHWLQAHRYTMI